MELLWQPANSPKEKQSEFIFLHECRVKVLFFQHPHILERVVAFSYSEEFEGVILEKSKKP